MACSQSLLGKARQCKCQSFIKNQPPWVSLSSCLALKIKIIAARKAGDVYNKIATRFQVAAFSVRKVSKKWQLTGTGILTGTVEVKLRSGRPRKLSERTAHRTARKGKSKPLFDCKRPSGRFSRLWSGGELFYCAATPAQI